MKLHHRFAAANCWNVLMATAICDSEYYSIIIRPVHYKQFSSYFCIIRMHWPYEDNKTILSGLKLGFWLIYVRGRLFLFTHMFSCIDDVRMARFANVKSIRLASDRTHVSKGSLFNSVRLWYAYWQELSHTRYTHAIDDANQQRKTKREKKT